MVSPVAGPLGSRQVELIAQRGPSSHTVHLKRQKRWSKSGTRGRQGPCETLASSFPALARAASQHGLPWSSVTPGLIPSPTEGAETHQPPTLPSYLLLQMWELLQENQHSGFNKGALEGLVGTAPLSLGLVLPLLEPLV